MNHVISGTMATALRQSRVIIGGKPGYVKTVALNEYSLTEEHSSHG